MRAHCLIRPQPHYRREAFVAGLAAAGCDLAAGPPAKPGADDVLVIWNRYGAQHALAERYERAGATVIVAENGYLGVDDQGRQLYALARRHHAGAGSWFVGAADRWAALGIEVEPWRQDGDHVLVLEQRGIGPPDVVAPRGWADGVAKRLQAGARRPVRIRRHPAGQTQPATTLGDDLAGAWAVVVWASGAGLKAIVAGVPAFYEMPFWIGAGAARFGVKEIERPFAHDGRRLMMLHRLAWAQWTVHEIENGEPFRHLLRA